MRTLIRPGLSPLVGGVRDIVAGRRSRRETALAAAAHLRTHLPTPEILTEEERKGRADGYHSFPLHTEPGFSVVAVVWRPGQGTPVHDHLSWCAFAVLSGVEHETLYRDDGDHLTEIGRAANRAGEVSGFAPPGDIHAVRNTGAETGLSIHLYGADVSVTGSSVRRVYDLPIR